VDYESFEIGYFDDNSDDKDKYNDKPVDNSNISS
jgi:hypothetical protein